VSEPFSDLYKTGGWNNSQQETASGPGSTLDYTETLRKVLPNLLEEYDIKSIVDAGCGDFNWMAHIDLPDYTGIDIVPELIEANQKYATDNIRFVQGDITQDLPEADLTIVRFVFIHISNAAIKAVLDNVKSKYLLAGTYPLVQNQDVPQDWGKWVAQGRFREVNLEVQPFNLGEPIYRIMDVKRGYPKHQLALWDCRS
jgi:SAM-dependent methyltransferase